MSVLPGNPLAAHSAEVRCTLPSQREHGIFAFTDALPPTETLGVAIFTFIDGLVIFGATVQLAFDDVSVFVADFFA